MLIDIWVSLSKNVQPFASNKLLHKEVRMPRRKKLDEYFFAYGFFPTKKNKKSSRGTTCWQLVVTIKKFVFVVTSECEDEVLLTIKHFLKKTEDPYGIIIDLTRKEKYQNTKVMG